MGPVTPFIRVVQTCIMNLGMFIGVKDNLSYEEVPIQILGSQVKNLRNKEVASLKVLWKNHLVEGAT